MEGLLSGLTRVWMADMRGRVLLIGWATTFVGVTTRAFLQKRKNKKVQAAQQQAAKGKDASNNELQQEQRQQQQLKLFQRDFTA